MATGSRCEACRQLRKRYTSDCIFLSYFSPNDPQRFAVVHKIFGTNNAGKMLKELYNDIICNYFTLIPS